MPEVIIHDDDCVACERAGILSDLRKHGHYEKPSARRGPKMNAARRKGRRPPRPA